MNSLISNGIVDSYQPLADIPGSYTAQFEHVSSPPNQTVGEARFLTVLDSTPTRHAQGDSQSW